MILETSRLAVEIAEPAAAYNGPRFDRSGFITGVTLDRSHTFCTRESLENGQGSGGVGLCNEFGIFQPIGFEDAAPGEGFIKPGVGLLIRPDTGAYDFKRHYDFMPVPVEIEHAGAQVTYRMPRIACRGYAVRFQKTVRLEENWLHIEYTLNNVGERRIVTQEYNHNFLSINGARLGPEYSMSAPVDLVDAHLPSVLQVDGLQVEWKETPRHPFYCRQTATAPGARTSACAGPLWELIHRPSRACVREYGDYSLQMFALWGNSHVVSPETFVAVDVLPGESQTWARRYQFCTV